MNCCQDCKHWDLNTSYTYPTGFARRCALKKRTKKYGPHFTLGKFGCGDFKEIKRKNNANSI